MKRKPEPTPKPERVSEMWAPEHRQQKTATNITAAHSST
jgi:hypothetical protein